MKEINTLPIAHGPETDVPTFLQLPLLLLRLLLLLFFISLTLSHTYK